MDKLFPKRDLTFTLTMIVFMKLQKEFPHIASSSSPDMREALKINMLTKRFRFDHFKSLVSKGALNQLLSLYKQDAEVRLD